MRNTKRVSSKLSSKLKRRVALYVSRVIINLHLQTYKSHYVSWIKYITPYIIDNFSQEVLCDIHLNARSNWRNKHVSAELRVCADLLISFLLSNGDTDNLFL